MNFDADIVARYNVGSLLGKGSFGVVYAATDRKTGNIVAIKIMSKEKLGAKGQSKVRREINVMTLLQHPRILRLHQALYTPENIVLVLDLVEGGELLQHLIKLEHYSERTASEVMRNLLVAVKYMHEEGIVHRDLKPDNMLLTRIPKGVEEVTDIKLADFGFSTKFTGEILVEPCGTPYYIAPEILQVGVYKNRACYNELADLWSAGVVAFLLLAGYPPFNASDKAQLFKAIVSGKPNFGGKIWNQISKDAKNFVEMLLEVDPLKRPSAEQALKHKWIAAEDITKPDVCLSDSLANLKEFHAREKMKGAVFGVEATLRLMYLAKCTEARLRPNSAILEAFTATTERMVKISLKNNYLGAKGLETLVETLTAHSEVEELDLTNCIIDDKQCAKILLSLIAPSSKIHTLILDDNPITHSTGRKLLSLLQARKQLRIVSCQRTHIANGILRKIDLQLKFNEEIEQLQTEIAKNLPNVKPSSAGARASNDSRPNFTNRRVSEPKFHLPQVPGAATAPGRSRAAAPQKKRSVTGQLPPVGFYHR